MARTRRLVASSVVVSLALMTGATGVAHADSSIAECVAQNQGLENVVCHEVKKVGIGPKSGSTPRVGKVRVSWQLVPGTTNQLKGGLWMVRSPIAGQRTGSQTEYPSANSRVTCSNGNPNGFQNCAQIYEGPSGSFTLEFPVAMAGYQYILEASETLSNEFNDTAGADLSDNASNVVVWVNQAFSYRVNGRTVVRKTCPPSKQNVCRPAVLLELNSDVGNGMPVSPVN